MRNEGELNPIPACATDLTLIAGWHSDWHRPDLGVTIPRTETWRFRRVGAEWVRVEQAAKESDDVSV